MSDPRIIGTVSLGGFSFKIAMVTGPRGAGFNFLPGNPVARDPNGTQEEQSQGRLSFDFDAFAGFIDIVPASDPLPGYTPTIDMQNLSIGEDGTLTGQFTATDQDDNLDDNSWVQVGSLTGFALAADGSFTYTPPASFQSLNIAEQATVSVVVRVSDTDGNSSPDTSFDIVVTGAADAPTVTAVPLITTSAAASVTIDLTGTDPEDDISATGWLLSTPPAKGAATIAPGGVGAVFDPNGDFDTLPGGNFEDVTFGVTVEDDEGLVSAERIVTVRVTGAAAAPLATNGGATLGEDQTAPSAFDLAALCVPGTSAIVSYELVTQPADVTVGGFNPATGTGTLLPSPAAFQSLRAGQTATRPFQFRCTDANGFVSNAAAFTVTIAGADDIPTVPDPAINLNAGQIASVVPNWSDVDSAGLYASGPAFEWLAAAFRTDTGSTVDVGSVTFLNDTHQTVGPDAPGKIRADMSAAFATLPAGQVVTVQRNWRMRDAEGNWSASRKVRVFVTGVDQAVDNFPVMTPIAISTDAGVPVTVDLLASTTDADNDFSSWQIDSQALDDQGAVVGNVTLQSDGTYSTGRLRFAPGNAFDNLPLGQSAAVIAQVSATDASGNVSNIVDVTITVNGLAEAPVAQNYSITLNANQTFSGVLPAATDANGNLDPNGYQIFDAGSPLTDGVITVNADGSFDYDPNGVFDGLSMGQSAARNFLYTAKDTTSPSPLVSSPKTIAVTINGVAPMAMEPMYPAASRAALVAKYPWEEAAMSRFMALESAFTFQRTAVQSGSWTSAATWGGTIPQPGDNVLIPYGITVTANEARTVAFAGNKAYGLVSVHGVLVFAPFMNVRLRCDTLIGYYGAHLEMLPAFGITHEISIVANGNIDVAKDRTLLTRGIVWHGTTNVMGYGAGTAAEKDPYVNVDYWGAGGRKPVAGDTQIILERAPVGWNVGDKVILPCAEQNDIFLAEPVYEEEERTITAINGSVITLNAPLTYNHDELPDIATHQIDFVDGSGSGGDRPQLVLCNFSRNIKFVSEGGNSIPDHQRPHIMLMHATDASRVNWCDTEIVDFDRTRKIVEAFTGGQMGANPIVADTNLKGRYSLHLHWVGVDPVDEVYRGRAQIRRNAFYRSPGWAFAQHRSSAYVEDNVSYDTFAHYVQESGDEIGEWYGNQAMRGRIRRTSGATGHIPNTKDAAPVIAHDMGHGGQGFFFQGRMIELNASARGWNRAYGCGEAFTWIHRGSLVSTTRDFGLHPVEPKNWPRGGAVAYSINMSPDEPSLLKVAKFQATGCYRGFHVIKSSPVQFHDQRTFFHDVIVTGCRIGGEWQYTQHYSGVRFGLVRSKRLTANQRDEGMKIYNNTPDMALLYWKIGGALGGTGGFKEAITTTHLRTGAGALQPAAGAWGYVFDGVQFGTQCGLMDNLADMPTFTDTRTGQDGVTGPEDRAFNMSFVNPSSGVMETFGAPPNSYGTISVSFNLASYGSVNPPAAAAQWNFSPGTYQFYALVTDAYGVRESARYFGAQDAYHNPTDRNDVNRRDRNNMQGLLAEKGYWKTPGGQYFVEDEFWTSGRVMDTPVVIPTRVYIGSNTPGIATNPTSNSFGNRTWPYNGVKA